MNKMSVRAPKLVVAAGALSICIGFGAPAEAQTLKELLTRLSQEHNRVQAAKSDVDAAKNREREAAGAYFPTLTAKGSYGYERVTGRTGTADTSMPPRETSLTLNQLITDFGYTSANIERARLSREQAETIVIGTQQGMLFDGVSAWLNMLRAIELVNYAQQSENNIRRQTGLEEARVERGGGLTTDALQAKQQLAGAQARKIAAEGLLIQARNRFRNVFGAGVTMPSGGTRPLAPPGSLPATVDEATRIALENNLSLKAANIGAQSVREQIRATTAKSYAPKIEAIGEVGYKKDHDGTLGNRRDLEARVQVTFPFNLGLTAINSIEAAKSDYTSITRRVADSRDAVEEGVRNAWQSLQTSRERAEFLRNRANILSEFITLAGRERQLGTRSLLDLLSGETALIDANADAVSAETDVAIAGFQLLAAMGRLELNVFN